MIFALYGADRLAVRQRRDALLREYAPDGAEDMALSRLDGSRCTPDELHTACNAISFFGGRRVVVVDDLMLRFESARRGRATKASADDADPAPDESAEAGDDADAPEEPAPEPAKGGKRGKATSGSPQDRLAARFAALLPQVPDDTVLILWERGEVRASNPIMAAAKKRGTVEEFKPPRGLALERWISDEARERGARIGTDVPRMLATYVGEEPEVLAEELDKLATYVGPGGTISEATVRLLTPELTQAAAFELVKATGQGDAARALSLLRQLLRDGQKTYAIVGMIGWQVRNLLQVQALAGQRLSAAAIGGRLGMQEFAVRQTQESLRFYTAERLRAIHRRLLAVDQEIKTTSGGGETALELLVLEMSRRDGAGGRR
jgi:DNA polymerase-3 subunit delta